MATDCAKLCEELEETVKCPICRCLLHQPKVLPCQHSFCNVCLENLVENVKDSTGPGSRPAHFECPTCRRLTFLPLGGSTMLPTDRHANEIMEILSKYRLTDGLSSSSIPKNSNSKTVEDFETDSDPDCSDSFLQWEFESENHIWDVDFFPDGSVLYADDREVKRLSNFEGGILDLPFQTTFRSPCGLSVCKATENTVVVDWKDGNNTGIMWIFKRGKSDETLKIDMNFQPSGLATDPQGNILLTATDLQKDCDYLTKYDKDGVQLWQRTYATDSLGPYITCSKTSVYISTPAINRIDIYDVEGFHQEELVLADMTEPRGVCCLENETLLVAKHDTGTVALFDKSGILIKELVRLRGKPNSVKLYGNSHLVVTDWQNRKLFLYEVNLEDV